MQCPSRFSCKPFSWVPPIAEISGKCCGESIQIGVELGGTYHIIIHYYNNIYIWTQQLETPVFVEDVIDVPEKRMLVGSEMLINLVDLRKQSADRRAICLFVAQLFYDHIGQVFMTREKVARRWHVSYFVML